MTGSPPWGLTRNPQPSRALTQPSSLQLLWERRSPVLAATLAAALPALFATSYARIWRAPAAATGNLLAVVLLIGIFSYVVVLGAIEPIPEPARA